MKVPQGIWQQIGIDLVGPLPQSPEGYEYMLTVIDYFSKWVELFALKDKKATSVAQCLFQLMCCFGLAKIHISDQGREFCNELHQQMYLLTGVPHRITGYYHPQANGLCERMNGTTIAALKKTVEEEAEDWYRLLDTVAYSYRATKHRATGLSPFEVLFGRKMGLPINLINNPEEEEEDLTLEQAMELEKQLKNAQEEVSQPEVLEAAKVVQKEIFDSVSKNICKEQNIQKNYFDKQHKGGKPLEVGTKVYRRNLTHAGHKGGKMDFSFLGPYTIVAVDGEKSVYTLQDDKGIQGSIFFISTLALWHESADFVAVSFLSQV